jgi:hypothetical protein
MVRGPRDNGACVMTILQPITLSEIDEYLEDLTAIVDTTKRALSLGLRARMAVSAGAQDHATKG